MNDSCTPAEATRRGRVGGLVAWLATRSHLSATLIVSTATLLVKVVATGKELLVAHRFGTSDALDAFLIAYLVPAFVINVLGGPLAVTLVPTYIRTRETRGAEAADRLLSNTLAGAILLFAALAALLSLCSPLFLPALGSSFSPEKQALARRIFLLLAPALVLPAVNAVLSAVLNSRERFAVAALVPLATPLATVLLLGTFADRIGIFVLVGGAVVGPVVETIVLALALRRNGVAARPSWHGLNDETRRVLRQYTSFLIAAALSSGSAVVDQALAAALGTGNVATLSYAIKVPSVLLAVSAGVWTSALPYFSRALASGDVAAVQRAVRTYVKLVLAVSIPVTALLALGSQPLVRVLFERGAFTSTDTRAVALVQASYLVQLPFYVLSMLYQRLTVALAAHRAIVFGSALNLVMSVSGDLALMRLFGLPGIALSSTVVSAVSLLYLRRVANRALRSTLA